MVRPQRQRRVPTRFLDAEETSSSQKATGGTSFPNCVSQPARPNKKRRTGAARDKSPHEQGACNAPKPQADTLPLVAETPAVDANATELRAAGSLGTPFLGAEQDRATPQATCRQPSAGPAVVECTSSDSSDVVMVEHRPSVTSIRKKTEGDVTSALQSSIPGRNKRTPLSDLAALRTSPAPPVVPKLPPAAKSPHATQPDAQGPTEEATPKLPDPLLPSAEPVRADGKSTPSVEPPPDTAAPLSAEAAPSSPKGNAQSLAPAHFQPLFDREDTPPRPDFADSADVGSDSCSDDGLDILAPRGRRGKKAVVRPGRRGVPLDLSPSPSSGSPDGRERGTPAQRPRPPTDTTWLDLPSPEVTRGGDRAAAESATLLRLRQQRAELLALARGASLASDRIQAQSAAEARLLEAEREREAAEKEAEATARAEAVVAAALRSGQPQEDSDDAGHGREAEAGGAAASILVKVRASDGSQERFKIRSADPLEKLFRAYLKKSHPGGIPAGSTFSFRFDGDPIADKQTPEELGLEDDDMIEVIQSK